MRSGRRARACESARHSGVQRFALYALVVTTAPARAHCRAPAVIALLTALTLPPTARAQEPLLEGFVRSPWFGEQVRMLEPAPDVRLLLNAPGELDPDVPLQVIFFATPNGNTLEQTLGCQAAQGLDWHYDIQHVAAQVRRLREVRPEQNIVLACLEAEGLSWPAWRARHGGGGAGIRDLIAVALEALPGADERLVLCAHSGGGSFLWGFLEDGEAIPAMVERIVFLDANYSYSDELGHGSKLLAWLRRSAANHLFVLAYDDREIEYQGKKVVGPSGGTFRASARMLDFFGKEFELEGSTSGDLEQTVGLGGRFAVLRHLNPHNRILHTALVGEMNGLLHALTWGDDPPGEWGEFGGPRAYLRWIQPLPEARPPGVLPPRPESAPGGVEVMRALAELPLLEREDRILAEIERGNVPAFLRRPVTLQFDADDAEGHRHRVRYRVAPDYLAVGSDRDFVRVPLTPMTAQRIADRYGFALPTRRMVAQIHEHAAVKLEPRPMGEPRQAVATFLEHQRLIEAQRGARRLGLLVAGIKKDLVITPQLSEKPGKVAIFGWHHPDGTPIQPLYTGHIATYVDYSHGLRLCWTTVEIDGRERALAEVLADPLLHPLLSDEGLLPLACQRYRSR